MCHLLLLLPVVALPVFWFLPMSVSVPVYAVASGISVAIYLFALKAMRRPVRTGREHLIGAKGRVVDATDGHMTVWVDGESWSATSDRQLATGDQVRVVALDGLILRVEPGTRQSL